MVARLKLHGGNHPVQVAPHDDDVPGLDGHVDARAHGDADVGLGQGRGVVDPVADHGHPQLLPLQLFDPRGLFPGQHPGDDLVDAGLRGNGPGGLFVVAGEHDHPDAHLAQPQRPWPGSPP